MKKNVIWLFAIFVMLIQACQSSFEKKEEKTDYSKLIIKNHLQKEFDNASWELYKFYFNSGKLICRNRNRLKAKEYLPFYTDSVINLYPTVKNIKYHNNFWILNMTLDADSLCGYCQPVKRDSGNIIDLFIFRTNSQYPLLKDYDVFDDELWLDSVLVPSFHKKDTMWTILEKEYYRRKVIDEKQEALFRKYLREHKKSIERNSKLYQLAKERMIL